MLRRLLRFALRAALWIYFPSIALGILTVRLISSAVNRYSRGGKLASRNNRDQRKERGIRQQNEKARYYSVRKGWDVGSLPYDMSVDLSARNDNAVRFTAAGIPGLVSGEGKRNGEAVFSFHVDDPATARKVSEKMNGADVRVRQSPEGGFIVSSGDAVAINEAAKTAYPEQRAEVKRELRHVRQYVVSGCGSYEEAVESLKENPSGYALVNSFATRADIVNGVPVETEGGKPLDTEGLVLPDGAFLVTEESVSSWSGKVTVPYTGDTLIIQEALDREFGDRLAASEVKTVVNYADATPEGAARRVWISDDRSVVLGRGNDLEGMKACLRCSSFDELQSVLKDGKLPGGAILLVGKEFEPSVASDPLSVFVDLDAPMLSALDSQIPLSESDVRVLKGAGASENGAVASLLADRVSKDGYATVIAREGLSLDGAKVGRVRASELAERLSNDRLPKLDEEGMKKWIRDAGRIESVTYTLDMKAGLMKVTAVVDGVPATNVHPVTEKEMDTFAARGMVSAAEKKDILMQCHPDFFDTYSAGGKKVYADPMKDFLENRKPQKVGERRGEERKIGFAKPRKPEVMKPKMSM